MLKECFPSYEQQGKNTHFSLKLIDLKKQTKISINIRVIHQTDEVFQTK